ncbi:GntR family transcriptional regulator [Bradyrhizobium sp. LA7.1]|uniref:GntR family transcriptional regulator n=1 Tax=Bradyrhizobium sp. LA7.1 TaxID=3156324 RepID=UPI00339B3F41
MAREPTKLNLREQAYETIRGQILAGEYSPDTLLSENGLAGLLGFSRTPIREAIRDLAKAGLVDVLPKRGIVVRGVSATDILEVFQIREVLEGLAVKIAIGRLTDADIEAMESDHARSVSSAGKGKKREAFDHAVKMHQHIRAACNNHRLDAIMHTLDDQVHQLGLMTLAIPGRLEKALAEHDGIIKAIRTRNTEKAEKLMIEHLQLDREAAIRQRTPAR